jgi:hypothetical protein
MTSRLICKDLMQKGVTKEKFKSLTRPAGMILSVEICSTLKLEEIRPDLLENQS